MKPIVKLVTINDYVGKRQFDALEELVEEKKISLSRAALQGIDIALMYYEARADNRKLYIEKNGEFEWIEYPPDLLQWFVPEYPMGGDDVFTGKSITMNTASMKRVGNILRDEEIDSIGDFIDDAVGFALCLYRGRDSGYTLYIEQGGCMAPILPWEHSAPKPPVKKAESPVM